MEDMRFKEGSKVEVLNEKKGPSGAWQCAVILSGNGHTYSVRYDWCANSEGRALVDKVPCKAIRPCPPPVQCADCWAVGDVVEVFDVGFWKMATVVKVFDENYYLVRLLGSFEEFRIQKSRIRVRQVLEDDKWIIIGKGPGSACNNHTSSPVSGMNLRIKLPVGNDCLPPLENSSCEDSHTGSLASLKRPLEYYSSYPRKMRAVEKVDAVTYPRDSLAENYVQTSTVCSSTQYYEKKKGILNGANSCFTKGSDSVFDTDACSIESVGSCSVISNSSNKWSSYNLAGHSDEEDTLSSDAGSLSGGADVQEKLPFPLKGDISGTGSRLELHAYRRTLMLIHASGSLSWDQEDLLTSLRMALHISNDEHLKEGDFWRLACLASKVVEMVVGFSISLFTIALSIHNFLFREKYRFFNLFSLGLLDLWTHLVPKQKRTLKVLPVLHKEGGLAVGETDSLLQFN